ncbi:hypothetical protein WP1_049 [Pseudomonas phage WP1]
MIDRGLALAEDVVGSAGDLFDYAVNGVHERRRLVLRCQLNSFLRPILARLLSTTAQ